jgi:hypothetical protein
MIYRYAICILVLKMISPSVVQLAYPPSPSSLKFELYKIF